MVSLQFLQRVSVRVITESDDLNSFKYFECLDQPAGMSVLQSDTCGSESLCHEGICFMVKAPYGADRIQEIKIAVSGYKLGRLSGLVRRIHSLQSVASQKRTVADFSFLPQLADNPINETGEMSIIGLP